MQNKCTDVCVTDTCGENAVCIAENHSYRCVCPIGFISMDMDTGCLPVSRCTNNTCHPSAFCEPTPTGFECKCNIGHIGEPYTSGCKEIDQFCNSNVDCPDEAICNEGKCLNPCDDACGENTVCKVVNKKAACSCQEGFEKSNADNGATCMRKVVGCRTDHDCSQSICVDNECKFICRANQDCATGERCVYNMCMLPCIGNLQCPTGQTCAGGYCVLGCRNNKECSKGEACMNHQCIGKIWLLYLYNNVFGLCWKINHIKYEINYVLIDY